MNKLVSKEDFNSTFEFCSQKFSFINFFYIHYEIFHSNQINSLILIIILLPLCFICIKWIAENYLAKTLDKIIHVYRISQTIASITLIPFENGAPDIMVAMVSTEGQDGFHIALGSLLGAFVFSSCIVSSSVIYFSQKRQVKLKLSNMIKEYIFYAIGLIIILIYGFIETIQIWQILFFLSIYIFYIAISLKYFCYDEEDSLRNLKKSQNYNKVNVDDIESLKIISSTNKAEIEKILKTKDLVGEFLNYFWPEQGSLKWVYFPLKIIFSLSIPHKNNPLLIHKFQYIIIFNGLLTIYFFFQNYITQISFIAMLLTLFIYYLIEKKHIQKPSENIYLLITIIASIGWLKLFTSIVLDIILYISLLLKINETFLGVVVVSIGNSLGDLFAISELANLGDEVMALEGTFSSQIFNFYIGLSLNLMFGQSQEVKIFQKNKSDLTSMILIFLIVYAFTILICHSSYLKFQKSVFNMKFVQMSLLLYLGFVVFMICIEIFNQLQWKNYQI